MSVLATVTRSTGYDLEVWKLIKQTVIRAKWLIVTTNVLFAFPLVVNCYAHASNHLISFIPKLIFSFFALPIIVAWIPLGIWLRPKIFNYLSIDESGVIRPWVRGLGLWFWHPTKIEIIQDRFFPQYSRLVVSHKKSELCSLPIDDVASATLLIDAFNLTKNRKD